MGTSSRGGVEKILNQALLVGLLTLGRCPPHGGLLLGVGGHTPGRWRVFFIFGYFSGHIRPIHGTNPNRSGKLPLLK